MAYIIKVVQRHYFQEQIEKLSKQKLLKKSSHLDANEILRVCGHIQNISGSYNKQLLAKIPNGSQLAKLLIQDARHHMMVAESELP